MRLFEPAVIDKNEVCPICFKDSCALFNKLRDLAYGPEERSDFIRRFHKPVCERCKRRNCKPFVLNIDGVKVTLQCAERPAKRIPKHKHTPSWWRLK